MNKNFIFQIRIITVVIQLYLVVAVIMSSSRTVFDLQRSVSSSLLAFANPEELFSLAFYYECGKGVMQDVRKAITYYKIAAEKGHAGAQEALVEIKLLNPTYFE